ncbi:hypothetical protein [uncultured Psychroserpens sp.]|uniref:hypothetical protein n=1 Tax=uncultured Psychroserpens sp. TaxID=255436 RepID=UPI002608D79B|nr:hypothetical protein [uncultured Psychroserpens sp.]
MIDRNKSEWLYYRSIYKTAVGKEDWDDPKWRELHFPNEEIFCNQLLESSTEDFVKTLVWIFRDRYPIEFSYLKTSMHGLDEQGIPKYKDINTRKAQDIEPMTVESEILNDVRSVTVRFKQPQSNVFMWIETELEGLDYIKEGETQITYRVTDSPIAHVEAIEQGFTIHVNKDKIIY